MSTSTFGETSWDNDIYGDRKNNGNTNTKDMWLRLDDGTNEMRIITQPYQYLVHKVKKNENDPRDFGRKVKCSAIHGSCPLCDEGNKAKPRWLLGVIARKTGTYKILDISYAVFQQIRKLARNTQRWGNPQLYDIDIVVDRNGGANGYYSVQPISKEALSATDQQIRDNVDFEILKYQTTPLNPEKVKEQVAKIRGGVAMTAAAVAAVPVVDDKASDEEGEVEDFPEYASQ